MKKFLILYGIGLIITLFCPISLTTKLLSPIPFVIIISLIWSGLEYISDKLAQNNKYQSLLENVSKNVKWDNNDDNDMFGNLGSYDYDYKSFRDDNDD